MDYSAEMDAQKAEYALKVQAPDFSIDGVQMELERQLDRLENLASSLELRVGRYLRPDNRPVAPSGTGLDMPSDMSAAANFIAHRADTLRRLNNNIESILGRIDS